MHTNNENTRSTGRSGLVALNLALLGLLGVVSIAPRVDAQSLGSNSTTPRVRGEYTVVGGEVLGDTTSTVYVLDSANREMVSLRWNDSSKSLVGVGYRDLIRDANSDPDR